MPDIDEELRQAMEALAQKQKRCLTVHRVLALLETVCFWNVVGVGALFANVLVGMIWGNHYSNKGKDLAWDAYPWLEPIPFLFGEIKRGRLSGISVIERIEKEAEKTGDKLTLTLLRFGEKSVFWVIAGTLGYLVALILLGSFVPKELWI